MVFKEAGFRPFYHNFVVVPLKDGLKGLVKDFPEVEKADSLLTYCYYDREAGLTLDVLATARTQNDGFTYDEPFDEIRSLIRIGYVDEDELTVIPDENGELEKRYSKRLGIIKTYDSTEMVEASRMFEFLDLRRHEHYIDDIQVYFAKKDYQPELCWVRITNLLEHSFEGTLLNELDQDFGYHMNDTVPFSAHKTEEDAIICVADLD